MVALCGALVASGCGETTSQEIRSEAPPSAPDPEAAAATVRALNAFSTDLERRLANERGNLVVATFPLATSLAMARTGSLDETRAQLTDLLRLDPAVDADAGLATLARSLGARDGGRRSTTRAGRLTLSTSAALWAQEQTTFARQFLDTLAAHYDSGVRVVDFRSDPEAARTAINRWVSDQTDERITQLLRRGSIKQYTRFVLTSAASLQAPWKVPFDASMTRSAPFYRSDGSVVQVPTMRVREERALRYAKGDRWQAVELPYLGDELSMLVVMPTGDGFAEVEAGFGAEQLDEVVDRLRPTPLDLSFPTFQFTSEFTLNDALRDLGATSAFTVDEADFTGITLNEILAISEVATQTYIGIDEEGTDGEAATVIPRTPPERFSATSMRVDRPFLFFVRDDVTGLILQIGRVVDPTT
jgi:serpin B